MKKTFCLIETKNNNSYELLTRVLYINLNEKNNNCVIFCNNDTKKLIQNFPLNYSLNIEFILIKDRNYDLLSHFHRMIEAIRYTVKKFGSCIYLNNNLIQVRELEIPDEIIQQGIGFSKKYFNSHDINVNKK